MKSTVHEIAFSICEIQQALTNELSPQSEIGLILEL